MIILTVYKVLGLKINSKYLISILANFIIVIILWVCRKRIYQMYKSKFYKVNSHAVKIAIRYGCVIVENYNCKCGGFNIQGL